MTFCTKSSKLIILVVLVLANYNRSDAQLNCTFLENKYASNCMRLNIHNVSSDTIYAIMQSNLIQLWDTCYAFSVFSRKSLTGKEINISYHNENLGDNYSDYNVLYIYPDSTISFGVRCNNTLLHDSLFISMYLNAISTRESKKIKQINDGLPRRKKKKYILDWRWNLTYARPE